MRPGEGKPYSKLTSLTIAEQPACPGVGGGTGPGGGGRGGPGGLGGVWLEEGATQELKYRGMLGMGVREGL